MAQAYYAANIEQFVQDDPANILGALSRAHTFALEDLQKNAWIEQINLLQDKLHGIVGRIYFEFSIPRMGKRADVVLLVNGVLFVLEFKVGSKSFDRSAIVQVHDYALDLKNFHRGSHDLTIVPVLIATSAQAIEAQNFVWAKDGVADPISATLSQLIQVINSVASISAGRKFDVSEWERSGYLPTPTIVEAAQALYDRHGVDEISRSDAGAKNLSVTTNRIFKIIDNAKTRREKVICFVTGVPGAGKTLAGLNVATQTSDDVSEEPAVFLSGNGPLVEVLREALARDESQRSGASKNEARRKVSSFIQNIHHFRDDALSDESAPAERIVIFDEAQRAWTREQASSFMQRKRNRDNFDQSEPEFLISVMDRHEDWCAIICLVGGGQEINTGEAGLGEWLHALHTNFPHWKVHLSDALSSKIYQLDQHHAALESNLDVEWQKDLHLNVSMRSFRAENLSSLVDAILENEPIQARKIYNSLSDRYPMAFTRDLSVAKAWVKQQARGSERFGLLAASGARRLRAFGVDVRQKIEPALWFLNDHSDVRSSFYLEEVATEFDVQGLELDWSIVCWDADLRYSKDSWSHYVFKGTKWQNVKKSESVRNLTNAYRVLLTRARQGMVIYIPIGSDGDPTIPRSFVDPLAVYLQACGIPEVGPKSSHIDVRLGHQDA